jgi:hypothetical protein
VELIATSNQQYHARAFLSAEAAIERAMRSEAAFNSARDFSVASHVGTGIGKDSFRYTVTRPTNGAIQQVPTGNSEGVFGAIYFKITATGYSDHETIAENTQELYQIVPLADSITYNPKACAHSTSLDGTVANC